MVAKEGEENGHIEPISSPEDVTPKSNVPQSPAKTMFGLNTNENSRLLTHRAQTTNGGTLSSPSEGTGSYEELFKDSVPCPSCRGLGRVPKELENQLVALIPMKDGRLKPRRTLMYVLIAVILCMITAGLLIFFLLPRDINISSNRPFLKPSHIDLNATADFANFTVVNLYNVSNNNFYTVKISGVLMKAFYGETIIAKSKWPTPVEISARSQEELRIPIDFILEEKQHGSLVSHCINKWSWIHNLPILFEVTANYTYMGHSEQAFLNTFQTVSCHPDPTTTTSTTTASTTTTTTTSTTTTTPKPTTPKPITSTTSSTMVAPEIITEPAAASNNS